MPFSYTEILENIHGGKIKPGFINPGYKGNT